MKETNTIDKNESFIMINNTKSIFLNKIGNINNTFSNSKKDFKDSLLLIKC